MVMLFLLALGSIQAQEEWPLERCIQYALENNLNIKQAELGVEYASLDQSQSRHSRYPSLNASTSLNSNFGRSIDPSIDAFVTSNFISNGVSMGSGVTVFNGFRISNSIKKSDIDKKATESDLNQAKRDISLSVANSYLNALFADENLAIAVSQLETSQEQLKQIQKLIDAGVRPSNESLDIEAQIANNEQMVITSENAKVIALLNLKQLLRLDPDVVMKLQTPSNVTVETDPDLLEFAEVYNSALQSQPNVKAGDLRVESAIIGKKIAKSALMPSVSAFGNISSNYSNQGKKLDGFTTSFIDQSVVFNGNAATIQFEQQSPNLIDNPYFDQLNENLSYGVGLSASFPIYNNNVNRLNVERSKLNIINAETQSEQVKQNLKTTVQQALADAKASKRKLNASIKSVEAQTASFNNAEKKFNAGTINSFEYITQKNALAQAEVNAVLSKYEYLFASKIIDFYMGKTIKL